VLGRVPGVAGAYVATGHGPSGLTLGPYSARVVADLVVGRVPDLDLAPFRADRFQAPPRHA
jgi:D-amino-acid dehydrogenase